MFTRCRPLMAELAAASESVKVSATRTSGTLRVAIPTSTTVARMLGPVLRDFRAHYPEIDFVFDARQELVDIATGEVDLGIRAGPPHDSTLMGRFLLQDELGLFAATAYLERRGTPLSVEALATHDLVVMKRGPITLDTLFDATGRPVTIATEPWLTSNDFDPLARVAAAGLGIGILSACTVALNAPELIRVLPELSMRPPLHGLWLLYSGQGPADPKVGAFADFVWTRRATLIPENGP